MSLENSLPTGEVHQPKLDTQPSTPHEDSIVPVVAHSGDTESIDRMRLRLGLSRREALGALAGAMVLPGEVVEAQERVSSRLERNASYEEGLAFLRERARTQTTEDLYYFSRTELGTSWIPVRGTTNGFPGGASGGTFAPEDRRYLYRLRRQVQSGEVVDMIHTHPTRMLSEGLSEVDQRQLAGVPPSPVDLINMFGAEQDLSTEARDRLSFKVVCEDGTWTYSAEEGSPMSAAIEAGNQYFEQLSGPLARHARSAADDIRDVMEPLVRNVPNGRVQLRGLTRSIEEGSFTENLRIAPADLVMKRWMLEAAVSDPRTSSGGRQYIETILLAADAINQTLQANDPDGYTIEQMLNTVPQVADAESGFSEYQEFWNRRGVSLSFVSF